MATAFCSMPAVAQSIESEGMKQTKPNWPDVASDHWVRPVLMELLETYQIKLERPDGSFAPNLAVSRQEMAALLLKLLKTLELRGTVQSTDLAVLDALKSELAPELITLDERVMQLEDQTDLLAASHFDLQENFDAFKASLPFHIFGSIALRSCSMIETQNYQVLGNVFQVRFGAGLRGRVDENWDYGIRFLSQDNQSYNLSWFPVGGSVAGRAPISLDRYFIRWHPLFADKNGTPDFKLTVGKALNFLPETQLSYDEDVSFTGLQEELSWQALLPGWQELKLQLGQHVVLTENTFITTGLMAGKLSSDWLWGDWGLRTALAYSHYQNTNALAPLSFNQGYMGPFSLRNRVTGNQFTSDFHLLNGFTSLQWNGLEGWPVRFSADYINNLGAQEQNQAYLLGLQLGQLRHAGDWELAYSYRLMQQDSNLSLMVDDFYAGTDVAGHTITLGAQATDSTSAFATLVSRTSLSHPENGMLWILYLTLRQDF